MSLMMLRIVPPIASSCHQRQWIDGSNSSGGSVVSVIDEVIFKPSAVICVTGAILDERETIVSTAELIVLVKDMVLLLPEEHVSDTKNHLRAIDESLDD